MRFFLFLSLSVFSFITKTSAQTAPDTTWLGTGRIQLQMQAHGTLATQFLVLPDAGSLDTLSLLRELSLWVGGIDAGGNLHLAIQQGVPLTSDFAGGFRQAPGSDKVWKVTRSEIEQHLQDFADNGIIDQPLPAIYAWPAKGNAFSMALNGFAMDAVSTMLAAPSSNSSGNYNPSLGDFPILQAPAYDLRGGPDEMIFCSFHTRFTASITGASPMSLDGYAMFFTYYCDEADFLKNSVFGVITLFNTGIEQFDSVCIGLLLNADIGADENDYFGTMPDQFLTYFYEATGEGNGALPLFGIDLLQTASDTSGVQVGVSSVMPIHPAGTGLPMGMEAPQSANEFYNYLTGHWRDGTPPTASGNGYQSSGSLATNFFPGVPGVSTEWSEVSAQNPPGDRRALLTSGAITLKPSDRQQIFLSLNATSGITLLSEKRAALHTYSHWQEAFFYGDFFPPDGNPFDTLACLPITTTQTPGVNTEVQVFPNPATDQIYIKSFTIGLGDIWLLDVFGRVVQWRKGDFATEQVLSLTGLASGIYFLEGKLTDGSRFGQKVFIAPKLP